MFGQRHWMQTRSNTILVPSACWEQPLATLFQNFAKSVRCFLSTAFPFSIACFTALLAIQTVSKMSSFQDLTGLCSTVQSDQVKRMMKKRARSSLEGDRGIPKYPKVPASIPREFWESTPDGVSDIASCSWCPSPMHRCAPVKENVQNEATKAVTKKNALSQPEPFQNLSQSQALDHGLLCHPLFYFTLLCFVSTWSWVVSPSVGLCALPIPPNPLSLFVLRPGDQVACQKSIHKR